MTIPGAHLHNGESQEYKFSEKSMNQFLRTSLDKIMFTDRWTYTSKCQVCFIQLQGIFINKILIFPNSCFGLECNSADYRTKKNSLRNTMTTVKWLQNSEKVFCHFNNRINETYSKLHTVQTYSHRLTVVVCDYSVHT